MYPTYHRPQSASVASARGEYGMRRGALPDDQLSRNTRAQRKYRENPENAHKDRIRSRLYYARKEVAA
jgi:hypothetical protein